ncbi:LLM class flavin-dependent oxidoreductase [Saccharopolyspora phatthalungensis]|uniref:Limonene 1,2-monooxygenase n=1 Tax=Saccharopolyspora phatthalungensis TaxID=664693 RepID=A0A840Q5H1_9PSEU|nr:LLM class flavin-dependent oxidoreductase [Saccharopolyspora phatthalungensis]MBB5157752.1 limonene 1,2-monooxygenase [Saccharopolyspora phatthalungensis]
MSKLRFGVFLAPFHTAGQNPTLALHRDLELVGHLDALGYDEAWIGEHHSAGSELIASPEIFIATAAERTRHIKLGTGVISLAYHNPLWVADRMVLLDHLTRGRVMLGVGPGSLPTDSAMIGLNPTDTRELLEENIDIVLRLLRGETVTAQTRTHNLIDARLQLRPYSDPLFDVAVAAVASPTGPRLAGRHGIGLLSIGATLTADGFDALGHHWGIMTERAEAFEREVDRSAWRLVGPMHVAETREQAYWDVEHGIEGWFDYFQKIAAFPQMHVEGGDLGEMIAFIRESGVGVIGTVEDAAEQVQRLVDQSGGFGAMLLMAHDWANPAATKRSYELIAQHVMPAFQGQRQSTLDARDRASATRAGYAQAQHEAIAHMTKKYESERS